jgi:hypothetical protein
MVRILVNAQPRHSAAPAHFCAIGVIPEAACGYPGSRKTPACVLNDPG